jgi:hypothetical protein
MYKSNKIYTIYAGLVQSRLCTADYALLTTGCGKLTSFFEYEMPYEKGS